MTRTLVCGHCGDEFEGAVVLPDHECTPECTHCGETFDDKTAESRHECDDATGLRPADEYSHEELRMSQRERAREDTKRAEQKRLGVRR